MRVLHLIPSLSAGGAERQMVELAVASRANGIEPFVCFFKGPKFYEDELIRAEIPCFELDLESNRSWLKASRAVRRLIREIQPDILHCWLFDAVMGGRLARTGSFLGIPTVVSIQAPDYDGTVIRSAGWPVWKMELLKWVDRLSAKAFHEQFVCCSHYLAEYVRNTLHIPDNRISVIYNSIDPTRFTRNEEARRKIRNELKINDREKLFLCVGRLDPQKAQDVLLKAFALLGPSFPKNKLALVGTGGMEGELRALSQKLGIEDSVFFVGNQKDMNAWYSSSDVFVFPSLFEGFGIALAEAMAVGLPCITTRTGPLPELIEDQISGVLVEPGDFAGLADAMKRVIKNPEFAEGLGEQARLRVKRFSLHQSVMPQWCQLYETMAMRSLPEGIEASV